MKKVFLLLAALVIAVIFAKAQQQMPPIPIDSEVRIGKLDNGLTYYIRKNNVPDKQANFYIVQKVGSILEEENQRGLAHFLEHMAFNGSKNFPNDESGPGIISYLEKIGVKFGENLNAGTSLDYTIYNIDAVPTNRQSIIDSCMMILHDWSNFLLLRDKDIDKERKVIHEEWRTRQNMSMRMLGILLPEIYAGSKYANRLPIGIMEVIDNFEPKVLRDYYHKWYRPDLQGIIIVGDIDVDKTEEKVKAMFSDIKKPENPAEREYSKVPENDEPIISIAQDKENPNSQIFYMIKRDIIPADKKTGMDYLIYGFMTDMIDKMLTNRLQEMVQKENPPFAYAEASNGSFIVAKTKDAFQVFSMSNPGQSNLAIENMVREVNRVGKFGFTPGEYERAKAEYMSNLEKLNNEKDKQRSSYYINQYVNNFLSNEPIPSISDKFATIQQVINHIPIDAINQLTKSFVTEKNRVIAIMGTTKENYSSQNEIRELIKKVNAEELTAYVDKTINEPLMSVLPEKGKIVKEVIKDNTTEWTLSNGAKVVVRPTDFKDDEILISAFASGGSSVIDSKYINEIKVLDREMEMLLGESVTSVGGLGKFSKIDLNKVLAGKNVSLSYKIGSFESTIKGKSNIKDFETALQLLYLNATDIRKDEAAYNSFITRAKGVVTNINSNPMVVFSDSVMSAIYSGNPRSRFLKEANVTNANYDEILNIFKKSYGDAGKFVFTIVGNVKTEDIKPLIEQYIASLPSTKEKAKINKKAMQMRMSNFTNNFTHTLEVPKSSIALSYTGKLKYNLENKIYLNALNQILDIVLTGEIREKLGGTYGISINTELEKTPEEIYLIQLVFDTNPERRQELVDAIKQAINKIQTEGPKTEDLQKFKEFTTKQHADDVKRNEYVQDILENKYKNNADMDTQFNEIVSSLTEKSVRDFTNKLFSKGNLIEVSLSSK